MKLVWRRINVEDMVFLFWTLGLIFVVVCYDRYGTCFCFKMAMNENNSAFML